MFKHFLKFLKGLGKAPMSLENKVENKVKSNEATKEESVSDDDKRRDTISDESEVASELKLPEIKRLKQAVQYNKSKVGIFAPDNFPSWAKLDHDFGSETFAKHIGRVQNELGIGVDGFCGPQTINRMAERDREKKGKRSLIIGPRAYKIDSDVVTFQDDLEWGSLESRSRDQVPKQIVLHYDVSFNAQNTRTILERRGLSYHFIIDGDKDATIYQTSNPTLRTAYHAGQANNFSVGICINNPADPKYQDQDVNRRGRRRGIKKDVVHGRNVELLSFFKEQISKTSLVTKILCDSLSIPKEFPRDKKTKSIQKGLIDFGNFSGILGHYHVSESKIDPAPLDWEELELNKNDKN